MITTRSTYLLASCIGLLVAAALFAQSDATRSQDSARTQAASQTGSSSVDGVLAAWLLADNENEVALAEIALKRATNAEVKQFATRMIQEHRAMIKKLQQFAPQPSTEQGTRSYPKSTPVETTTSPQKNDEERASNQPSARNAENQEEAQGRRTVGPTKSIAEPLDIVALKRELNQQCLASTKRELEKKSGAEFDRCYAFHQVGAHIGAIDALTVFKNRASREFGQVLTEGLTTVQAHLEHAKSLAKKLDENREDKPTLGN